jgi:hypothetical protein
MLGAANLLIVSTFYLSFFYPFFLSWYLRAIIYLFKKLSLLVRPYCVISVFKCNFKKKKLDSDSNYEEGFKNIAKKHKNIGKNVVQNIVNKLCLTFLPPPPSQIFSFQYLRCTVLGLSGSM